MFCGQCGTPNKDDAKFCASCGAPLKAVSTASPSSSSSFTDTVSSAASTFKDSAIEKSSKAMDIPAIIGSILLIISLFLPFATVDFFVTESVSLMDSSNGIFFLILAVLVIVFAALKKDILVLIFSAITFGLMLIIVIDFNSSLGDLSYYANVITKNIGFYLLIISSLIMLGSPIVKKFILHK